MSGLIIRAFLDLNDPLMTGCFMSWASHKKSDLFSWEQLMDLLGNPSAKTLADYLGVTVRTVKLWKAKNDAPQPVKLALWWKTPESYNQRQDELFNEAKYYGSLSISLRNQAEKLAAELHQARAEHAAELANLRSRIAYLESLGTGGAANGPFYDPFSAAPAPRSVQL